MAMEKGTSASAASESRNGKSRSYKRSEDDGKATEEGAPDLRKNTDEMQEEAEKLRETAPLTIEVTVGEKSCKVVVQKGKLLSSEGDKDLMTQYELDYEGKLRDMATGAAAPGYRFRVSFSAFKNTTKTSKDPAGGGKGPTPQKKGGEK